MSNNTFKVKKGLTLTPVDPSTLVSPQAGDIVCDSTDSNKIKRYNAVTSSWDVVGSSQSFDTVFALDASDASTWSTGKNASFLGGGTISGTFAANTSSPLNGTSDYKYTNNTSSATSGFDYFACPAQSVPVRFRGQTVTLYFPYTYNGANNDIRVVFYDATNGAEIPSSVYIQASTGVSIFKTNFTIPSTCSSIRIGFQTVVADNGKIFEFDDVQLTSDTTIYADIINQTQYDLFSASLSVAASSVVITAPGSSYGSGIYTYNSTTGIHTFLKSATVSASVSMRSASASRVIAQVSAKGGTYARNGSEAIAGAWANASATLSVAAGDTLNFTNAGSGATDVVYFTIVAQAVNENIVTAPDTFSTDTNTLTYASSASYTLSTLANAPVGTFITYTTAASTNTITQTTTAPTQTVSDMNTNGILVYCRNFGSASTSTQPAYVAIQIGKGMKGVSINAYKSASKTTPVSLEGYLGAGDTSWVGMRIRAYDENTGVLLLNLGSVPSSSTSSVLLSSDNTNATSAYFTINASKNPALTGMNVTRVTQQIFTSSGTWTRPYGCTAIEVEIVGGGGGGGGAATTTAGQGAPTSGGGSGAYAKKYITSPNSSETVTIGAAGGGGALGTNGTAGGTTSFGSVMSATGGSGGATSSASSGTRVAAAAAGGTATGGDINLAGEPSGIGWSATATAGVAISGNGGSSKFGSGGEGKVNINGASTGSAGTGYGAGGGGACNGATGAAGPAGGTGTAGICIVKEYYS
jgi:plastocyanin